jgi:NADPH:quinone reductase-like Zn-dependent oxidoreductase
MVALLQLAIPICAQVFQEVMGMLAQGIIKPVNPMTFMPFSRIEEGFRTMQIGKHIGKIVLEAHDGDLVPVSNHPSSTVASS